MNPNTYARHTAVQLLRAYDHAVTPTPTHSLTADELCRVQQLLSPAEFTALADLLTGTGYTITRTMRTGAIIGLAAGYVPR